ncbi:hypothetical protein [Leptospira noguchii]|uniref:Uncharacterized protein n=1 Tax=Leptospira noguchii TaxID=28182 RepID=A0AAE9K9V4_9LEPT|nr:hypothetical protein [Leptospira noguchii]UOG51853.1 hypothetical protein MAL09_14530 [Leptospira noguchii]UOG57464.1 hypothetical protein MAL03_04745 [Leptospira noguchii]
MKLKQPPPELSISLLWALEVTQRLASIGARSNSANTYRCLGFGTSSY